MIQKFIDNFEKKMYQTDATKNFQSMKLPEFLNNSAKWVSVVESIDTAEKFDDIALKILDDDDIDVFEFRDIIVKLAEDVRFCRPKDGEIITLIADTVVEMLDYLIKKSEERFDILISKVMEGNVKLLK